MEMKLADNSQKCVDNTMVMIGAKLPRDVLLRLDREAARQERTRSDLVRILIRRALANPVTA